MTEFSKGKFINKGFEDVKGTSDEKIKKVTSDEKYSSRIELEEELQLSKEMESGEEDFIDRMNNKRVERRKYVESSCKGKQLGEEVEQKEESEESFYESQEYTKYIKLSTIKEEESHELSKTYISSKKLFEISNLSEGLTDILETGNNSEDFVRRLDYNSKQINKIYHETIYSAKKFYQSGCLDSSIFSLSLIHI